MTFPLQVVATAGHVDHGKSSLIARLTGIDPDRWEEEKRRGLTIDLGFAWLTLPSGREIGFVDVPGHERFVRNMLAGVGPVRLVLFVVAADEGWKPQSEEHLEIVDVLGAAAAVVALTKSDLVDGYALSERHDEIHERLSGTSIADSPIVACSSTSGVGIEELVREIDRMVAEASTPEDQGRPRIHIDRSFSIKGAGTVVTGTLTGGSLGLGEEVAILPQGTTARVRSLQTHRRSLDSAHPVSRVAANLSGIDRDAVSRGDVLVRPGQWRPSSTLDVLLKPARSVTHPLTGRGAYKLYAGSAERDARLRLHEATSLDPGQEAFARLRLSSPIVAQPGDRFVLREAGRRETVGGGVVLDPHPPARAGSDVTARLRRRLDASPEQLPSTLVSERGAVRAGEIAVLTGRDPSEIAGSSLLEGWWISNPLLHRMERAALGGLEELHISNPLLPGMEAGALREHLLISISGGAPDEVVTVVLAGLEKQGAVERRGTLVRRAGHEVSLGEREPEARALVELVEKGEPTPPTQRDLEQQGFQRDLIEACVATGRLARVSAEVLVTPSFLAGAEELARAEAGRPDGLTVSRFRELIETTRKYALPILGSFDERGITRRDGDVRRLAD
ncbi:MAG: selenocysteine-specific translation elongation factor [Actinomycetota bacterium]